MPEQSPNEQKVRQIVHEEIQANNAVLLEAMRDMQTEILRGLERFSRGNFSRLHRLESSDNDLNERIKPSKNV